MTRKLYCWRLYSWLLKQVFPWLSLGWSYLCLTSGLTFLRDSEPKDPASLYPHLGHTELSNTCCFNLLRQGSHLHLFISVPVNVGLTNSNICSVSMLYEKTNIHMMCLTHREHSGEMIYYAFQSWSMEAFSSHFQCELWLVLYIRSWMFFNGTCGKGQVPRVELLKDDRTVRRWNLVRGSS